MKKSQSSIEFTIVLSMVLLAFSVFLIFFNVKMLDIQENSNHKLLINVGEVIKSEIELASSVEKGYERSFYLPETLSGLEYKLIYYNGSTLTANYSMFVLSYVEPEISNDYVFFTPPNVSGKIKLDSDNNITKLDQMICINGCI